MRLRTRTLMLYSVALPLPGPSWHLLGRTSTRHASGRLGLQLQKSKNVPQIPCFILHTPCMFETQAQRRAAGLRTGLSCVTFGHGPKPPRFSQTGSLGPSVSLLAHAFLVPSSLRVTKYRDPKWVASPSAVQPSWRV
ncbi:hypothetical protein N656DRAFT_144078 [Canariomyces notabilis]|uniref:Uncharacterized protein n=1 Tax=Canariomyces notabilis TaxID=2074819 RepID=A0AAN6TC50_9PEZI|nr:hypothetical protein N656DRAFT_144078 [Canariomyces arenarius]